MSRSIIRTSIGELAITSCINPPSMTRIVLVFMCGIFSQVTRTVHPYEFIRGTVVFLSRVPGLFETHTSSDLVQLCNQIHAFELKVQVAIAAAFEFEVFGLPNAQGTGVDGINERSSVGVNGAVAVERVKHIVDSSDVLLPIRIHAVAATVIKATPKTNDH